MRSTHAILLASTALLAVTVAAPSQAAPRIGTFDVAQAAPPPPAANDDERKRGPRKDAPPKAAPPAAKPPAAQAPAPAPQRPAAAPPAQPQRPAAAPPPQRPAQTAPPAQPKPPAPAAQAPKPPAPAAQPPAAAAPAPAAPPRADRPGQPRPDNNRAQRRDDRTPPAAAAPPAAKPPAPAAAAPPAAKPPAPAAAAPVATPPAGAPPAPAAQQKPPAPAAAAPAPAPTAPAQPPAATARPAAPAAAPAPAPAAAAPPPPTQPRNANEFIRRGGQPQQTRGMDEIRKDRRETRDGNRVIITEGDRTIVRDGNRTIIRHSEADRFAVGARDVRVERRGADTVSVIVRPNGVNIVSTTGPDGHLLRRVSRDRNGREVVIIDNGFAGARRNDWFVTLPPPVVRIPRDRYIVDAGRATAALIFGAFTAPPVEVIEQRYTVDQVRYSAPLRDRMPRVDLDVNFETGSWQLSPDQIGELSEIAAGLNRAIEANPREVFLIEGHTDAVGSNEDNLSLSDRRAESVAVALTEQFQVPPENLLTQGYGEENLKVQTDGPERANRYVAVRRITPLIAQTQTQGGGAPR